MPPASAALARHWPLDPRLAHLNHGSFGGCPTPVLAVQAQLRQRLERDPMRFFLSDYEPLLDEARRRLAAFVGARPENLVFVANATTGVSTVLRSLDFGPADEILVTDHEYNACRNALDFVAARSGATVVVAPLPFPVGGPGEITDAILARVTARTRLLLVDHVTSPTGLVLPVERLVGELAARGVDVLVDGAHGPGMLPLDLESLGAAYYTGNCHKWLCTPRPAALLYVRPDRQAHIHPLAISHGANSPRPGRSRFWLEFDWVGTQDPTALMSIPAAIEFLGGLLPGGWPALQERNHQLACEARRLLCQALQVEAPCPESMLGSMAALILEELPPARPGQPVDYDDPLAPALRRDFGIIVPVLRWPSPPRRILRISAQAYNWPGQYARLADVLPAVLGG
jgi:isopenicillin-N epimerase